MTANRKHVWDAEAGNLRSAACKTWLGISYLPGSGVLGLNVLAGQAQKLLYLEHIARASKRTGCEGDLAELRDLLIQGLGNLQSMTE